VSSGSDSNHGSGTIVYLLLLGNETLFTDTGKAPADLEYQTSKFLIFFKINELDVGSGSTLTRPIVSEMAVAK
jgi:hypothetical protein